MSFFCRVAFWDHRLPVSVLRIREYSCRTGKTLYRGSAALTLSANASAGVAPPPFFFAAAFKMSIFRFIPLASRVSVLSRIAPGLFISRPSRIFNNALLFQRSGNGNDKIKSPSARSPASLGNKRKAAYSGAASVSRADTPLPVSRPAYASARDTPARTATARRNARADVAYSRRCARRMSSASAGRAGSPRNGLSSRTPS